MQKYHFQIFAQYFENMTTALFSVGGWDGWLGEICDF